MVIYDEKNQILYIPSSGDKIIYDDYEEKKREAYQSGYTAGFAQGVSDAEEDCPYYPSYSAMPLTFEILSGGTVWLYSQYPDTAPDKKLEYSLNDGPWQEMLGKYNPPIEERIQVEAGDLIRFRGVKTDNNRIGFTNLWRINTEDAAYNICGNIMSIIYPDDFENKELSDGMRFQSCFGGYDYDAGGPISAENLILPDNVVQRCYYQMFYYAKNLKIGPVLPADMLEGACYYHMFAGCKSIEQITMLATKPEPINPDQPLPEDTRWSACLNGILYEANSTGTFFKKSSVNTEYIKPNLNPGWTVVDLD